MCVCVCAYLLFVVDRKVWEANTGNVVRLGDEGDPRFGYTTPMCGVAWHPTLDIVATCSAAAACPIMLFCPASDV